MVTLIIIVITSVVSFMAFNNSSLVNNFIFYPPAIKNKEWYRFFTYGLLHADLAHLIFNMFALYLFGTEIEKVFKGVFANELGTVLYILMYVIGLIASILPTYFKEKNNYNYRSLGASGAVSAVVFAYILIYPMNFMGIMFIPIYLPAFLFGIIYVIVSVYLDKKQAGNINHLAHITGGIFGIMYMFIVFMAFVKINIFSFFIQNIQIASVKDLIHFGF
ncbi:Rhomboid family protein [uncultured Paludibacter sp.]|uniref:Rhomboid family protein n=1 Tax=uncultured Paludibacter sp. TaxID=497635 RepID=A0A653AJU3_9BACT|nr:Rhomboid family protein [uncultured Paludibacter sp.]